jgi:hypothetical protein
VEAGLVDYTEAEKRLDRLGRQEKDLRARERRLLAAIDAAEADRPSRQTLEREARRLLDRVRAGDLPFHERQAIVRQFVVGISVGTDTLVIRAHVPDGNPVSASTAGVLDS